MVSDYTLKKREIRKKKTEKRNKLNDKRREYRQSENIRSKKKKTNKSQIGVRKSVRYSVLNNNKNNNNKNNAMKTKNRGLKKI